MTDRLGGSPWARTVRMVVRRDGGICHICGGPGADSADHLNPRSKGGTNAMSNLKAAHHNVEPYCNRRRGDRSIEATRQKLRAEAAEVKGWEW